MGAKGGGKARGEAAKGGGKPKAAAEAGDGKGKAAQKGGKGGGKGGAKGGAKGRGGRGGKGGGRARVVAFASGVAGVVQSAAKASMAAVPILLAPLATSYSKIILYVLAISATSAPSLLLPAGGWVWGRAAPRTFTGAMAMKGASAAATRWAPSLLECKPVGLTAHYVAAQRLSPGAVGCTNWLAVCLVSPGLEGAPGTVWRGLGELD